MTKYSTGQGGGSGDGDACELCGAASSKLRRANVAGADLLVCPDCAPHGTNRQKEEKKQERQQDRDEEEPSRSKRAAQKQARVFDAATGDSTHWEEEGTDYEEDRLPYLVSEYGEALADARQEAGLTVEELAEEVDVDEDDVLAVEQGRAARADVGGSVVRDLEQHLDVKLVDE